MQELLQQHSQLFIKQQKEWLEIFTNWETKNKYVITTPQGEEVGHILEKDEGFISTVKRLVLRSHRPLDIHVIDTQANPLMQLSRPFFWFFSDLYITNKGKQLGSVHRRFGILYKKYELFDQSGNLFAKIKCPIWRLWTFDVLNPIDKKIAVISKKWQGLLKEAFSDADAFFVDCSNSGLSFEQRVVIFATAISIDFDFFENNQGAGSVLDIFNN